MKVKARIMRAKSTAEVRPANPVVKKAGYLEAAGAGSMKRSTRKRSGLDVAVAEGAATYGVPVLVKGSAAKSGSARALRVLGVAEEKRLAGRLIHDLEAGAETAADVNVLCEQYGLRREELGRLTGFSLRALADWAAGKLPSQPAYRRLHEIRRLLDALAELVERQAITSWLHQKNPAFGHLTPLQVIESGEIDRLWAMVHERSAGVAG